MIIVKHEWPNMCGKLESLFLQSFGRDLPTGYLDWRYSENGGKDLLFSVELADENAVASYSACPVTLECDGSHFSSALSMTTMTHPAWRGRGLFPRLAAELYQHAARSRFVAVWGFPNATSHRPFKEKLGWTDIYEIPTMTFDVASGDVGKVVVDVGVKRDDGFSMTYPEAPTDGLIRVHRSKAYLEWRYARNPSNRYRNYVLSHAGAVSSYVVAKSYGDGVDLVDIQASSPDEARALLSHVIGVSRDENVRQICCWAPTHHSLHGTLERLGFQNTAPITYLGGRKLIDGRAPNELLDFRSWYFQMGDSDVY
jgi:GNAT superfamily N-acetyltransferase